MRQGCRRALAASRRSLSGLVFAVMDGLAFSRGGAVDEPDELAQRLEVNIRTLRRYINMLQGVGRALAIRHVQRVGSPVSVALGDLLIDRKTLLSRLNQWFYKYATVDDAAVVAQTAVNARIDG